MYKKENKVTTFSVSLLKLKRDLTKNHGPQLQIAFFVVKIVTGNNIIIFGT